MGRGVSIFKIPPLNWLPVSPSLYERLLTKAAFFISLGGTALS
jgi:hypothetical protein